MVFRCPTCGRFIKTTLQNGVSHLGTCKKCDIEYMARYTGGIPESGDYEARLTVWPAPSNPNKGKSVSWALSGE